MRLKSKMEQLTMKLIVDEEELFSATGFTSKSSDGGEIMHTVHEKNNIPRYSPKPLFPKLTSQLKITVIGAYEKLLHIATELFSDKKYKIVSEFEYSKDLED